MAVDRIIVDALVALKTEAELETLRSTVLEAYISRRSVNIHVSSSSGEFGSASGITLATQDEQRDFLESIAAALAELNEEDADISARAAIMDFSERRTEL